MDLGRAQIGYDNQEPEFTDMDKEIATRITVITDAVREKTFLSDGGKDYLAAEHVFDNMSFEVVYSIIQNAQSMDEMQLGEFVKKVVAKAIETAAENDIETNGV